MIVCNELGRRRWFIRGPSVPDILWPREEPGPRTLAHDLVRGGARGEGPVDVYADGWFDHPDAHRYGIREDSIKINPKLVLSLLWWKDERQLLDLETEHGE